MGYYAELDIDAQEAAEIAVDLGTTISATNYHVRLMQALQQQGWVAPTDRRAAYSRATRVYDWLVEHDAPADVLEDAKSVHVLIGSR